MTYCPFWPRSMSTSPFFEAATRNFEKLLNPRLRSSKPGETSIITCLSRSERITSPRETIRPTASSTHCQASGLPSSSPVALWSPVSDV